MDTKELAKRIRIHVLNMTSRGGSSHIGPALSIADILITLEEFGADREAVRLALDAEHIEARPVWKPMHMQPVFNSELAAKRRKKTQNKKRWYKVKVVGGKMAEDLFKRGLCLPSGTAMTEEDLDRVVSVIRKAGNW